MSNSKVDIRKVDNSKKKCKDCYYWHAEYYGIHCTKRECNYAHSGFKRRVNNTETTTEVNEN